MKRPLIDARKYFGPKRGVTWLNMINDQAAGLSGKVVAGTIRSRSADRRGGLRAC